MDLKDCKLCVERKYGTGPVPGCGKLDALVCLLGRNPGTSEDPVGRPFVGRAGEKLNEGLWKASLPRSACYVTNVSKCMTPKDVKPTQQCLRICSDTWLKQELADLHNLKLVVVLGNQALHYFLRNTAVGDIHGCVLPAPPGQSFELFVSYHPSAALRSTLMNQHFMTDMARLGHYLRKQKLVQVE